jgi:L-lysine 2,3-aminomutase
MPPSSRRPALAQTDLPNPRYRAYGLQNFRAIAQLDRFSADDLYAMEVVGNVLPFRTNSFVVDELIDWASAPDDPIFRLNFPQREMLTAPHFDRMADALHGGDEATIQRTASAIRHELNPHPAGQIEHNIPTLNGRPLTGLQHKYRETVLYFPAQGQTCHAYCTFCFRWPQFVGSEQMRFAAPEPGDLVAYLGAHPEVTDVLITGGDAMIMRARNLAMHIDPLLGAELPSLRTIRIGTKSLSYWPHRYLTDRDADDVLRLFERITSRGLHLAIMAHFNHPAELEPAAVKAAIRRIRGTGAIIRTQSPILRNINDDAHFWAAMWRRQVRLGMVPYYMFVVRDTGAQHYFGVPLVRAWRIFRRAYRSVSGLCRTVRGPSMSADPGKIQVLGVAEIGGDRVLSLRFLQGRDPDWVHRPFFARYDAEASWLTDLRPAFGQDSFFFESPIAPEARPAIPHRQSARSAWLPNAPVARESD